MVAGRSWDTLLLDRVLADAKRLRTQVGAQDRIRLDEYLSLMRSLGRARPARKRQFAEDLAAACAHQWQSGLQRNLRAITLSMSA